MEMLMNENEFNEKLQEISERVLSKALTEEEKSNYTETLFESIKHINEYGQEFWYARDMQITLGYKEWRNFKKVISKAIVACENSENNISDHSMYWNLPSPRIYPLK